MEINGSNPTTSTSIQHVRWLFPPEGWFKVNTDGASKGNSGMVGCGGVLRDDQGRWVSGFDMNIGYCSAFRAELWGILKGVELAWNNGIRRLVVESYSASIISLLNGNKRGSRAGLDKFIDRILDWKSRDRCVTFRHTLREGNSCTD